MPNFVTHEDMHELAKRFNQRAWYLEQEGDQGVLELELVADVIENWALDLAQREIPSGSI